MNAPAKFPASAIEHDPKRPGYCHAYKLNYRRELHGRMTRCQDGEHFFSSKADAERYAAERRRGDTQGMARTFGPLTVTVCRVYTIVSCLDRPMIGAAA